jgi:hypothetical protein
MIYSGGKASLVSINDNRGRGFRFGKFGHDAPYSFGEGLISLDVLENDGLAKRAGMARLQGVPRVREITVGLGAIRSTDVVRLSPASLPDGVDADLVRNLPARSAWTSLAFLLRDAAARLLDVGPEELVTEVSPRALQGGAVVGEVFIADRLENGAGYATWLSGNIGELMAAAEALTKEHVAHAAIGCDGSCYDCLRDYSNSPYHPLLDWFLAKEALNLVLGRPLDLVGDPWKTAVSAFGEAFGWSIVSSDPGARLLESRGRHLVVAHPLLQTSGAVAEPLRAMRSTLGDEDAMLATGYEIARRPGMVESGARAGLLPRLAHDENQLVE